MSTLVAPLPSRTKSVLPAGFWLAAGLVGLATVAALLAGRLPIAFSIATVFAFAGPHNWLEARYILGRLPARTGKLFRFFVVSFFGIVGLALSFALIPSYLRSSTDLLDYELAYATWNTAFLLWVATLITMRGQTNPRFDAGWVWPLVFLLIAGVWLKPFVFSIAIIYLHPLMALWLLDRELRRSRPHWRPAYHACLMVVPIFVVLLWWRLHAAPQLPGNDSLTSTITNHAGDWFIKGVSNHFLVATHTFLEMVHYGVWVVAIPLIGYRSMPWRLQTIPAARRSAVWRRGVALLLLLGLATVVLLWVCFAIDYETTRYIYFIVAILHVLAEVPFLLRMI